MSRRIAALVLLLVGCTGDPRTVLTVYSPHGKELLADYKQQFEKAHPAVDLQWVDMGAQEVLERVRAEGANPQADVWFGATGEIFDRAAKEQLLAPYRPTWAAVVDSAARDPHDLWYGTYLTPEVIAYNSDAVSEADAPKDWDDVLDPRWRDKVVIRDPVASGSMRAIFAAQIVRSIRATGSPDSGFAWLRRLDANTREYVLNPTILYQKLGRREGVITLYDMPDIAALRARTKIPVRYMIPTSGTPLLVDGIAIVKGTKHPELAREYYEYVTTKTAMLGAARDHLRIPARTDIADADLPDWIRDARARIRPMPLDRSLLAAKLDEWMTFWDASIRGHGRGP
ncbi:MAG: extracellular solute-binding protein [Gemmatimonadaceae bacterium]